MLVENKEVVVSGKFSRIARLQDEYYDWVEDPRDIVAKVKSGGVKADMFTFLQKVTDRTTRYDYHHEQDSIAVLPITTYEHWWTKQINVKTRNMVRKAEKCGVSVRVVEFNDDLIKKIKEVYDESPLRQGKPFKHYGKDLATLKSSHISFLNRSQFIGAFYGNELIGFIKLVHDEGISHLMQIISKISHRNKAPTNALIAKAVEICAQRNMPYLHYGIWSKRGLGDFKKHHAFEKLDLMRYFIPLNVKGKMILALKLHHKLSERLPQKWVDIILGLRSRWNTIKYDVGET